MDTRWISRLVVLDLVGENTWYGMMGWWMSMLMLMYCMEIRKIKKVGL